MKEIGNKILLENGGDINDVLSGFHRPPFNTVGHLHLHIISPASQMSTISRLMFRPNSLWFQCVSKKLVHIAVHLFMANLYIRF